MWCQLPIIRNTIKRISAKNAILFVVKHNPFSTRKTIPGKIPYFAGEVYKNEQGVEFLYRFFRNFDYRSQITGKHGTGKTTFLYEFVQYLERQGHKAYHFALHDRQRLLPPVFWERHIILVTQFKIGAIESIPISVIDGYEQLSLGQKIRLRHSCRKGTSGLLITTHHPAWRMPVLLRTKPTLETLQSVIAYLFRDVHDLEPPDLPLCRTLFDKHQGNLRNVWFDLYDLYEMKFSDLGLQTSASKESKE